MSELNRREALGAIAAGTTGIKPAARQPRLVNRIQIENDRDGTTDWQLTYVKLDAKARYRQPLIEGYCTRMSVRL